MGMLEEALQYAEKGWYVFPCWERERESLDAEGKPVVHSAKRPYTANGLHDASIRTEQIQAWWNKFPNALIGVNCEKSNLFVIDLDVKAENGIENFKSLDIIHDNAFHSKTPSGGWHIIFTGTGPSSTNGSTGIDTRGKGGYFIAPPSAIVNGKYPGEYKKAKDEDWSGTPGLLPEGTLQKLMVERTYGSYEGQSTNVNRDGNKRMLSRATREFIDSGAPSGSRNLALFKALADAVGCGYTPEEARVLLLPKTLEIGLDKNEFEETMRKAFSKPRTSSIPDEIQEKILSTQNPSYLLTDSESHIIEQAVIALIVRSKSVLAYTMDFLTCSDFNNQSNKDIFRIISDLYLNDIEINEITILDRMQEFTKQLFNKIVYSYDVDEKNIKTYVSIIRERSAMRRLRNMIDNAENIISSEKSLLDVVNKFEKELISISISSGVSTDAVLNGDSAVDMVDERTKAIINGDIQPLKTGFVDFDKRTGGLFPKDLLMIAGRPGDGKSALALSIIKNVAIDNGESVLGFFLEASTHETICRLITQLTGISFSSVFLGKMSDREWKQYEVAKEQIRKSGILFDDTSGITIPELRAKIRQAKNQTNLKLVVIDQLEQIRGYDNQASYIQLDKLGYDIKAMAKEFDIPIILNHQLNRNTTDRRLKDAEPELADLNQAGEKPVNQVWAIVHQKDELGNIISSKIKSLKNRNGPKVNFNVQFIENRMLFVNKALTSQSERSNYLVNNTINDTSQHEQGESNPYSFSPDWAS